MTTPAAGTSAAPVPGTPAHDAAMAATYEAGQAGQQQPAADQNRPAWLQPKFKTPEDLARAYTELEARLGQSQQQAPATPQQGNQSAPGQTPADGTPAAETVDWNALSDEVATNRALSPESRAALIAKGIPEPLVDSYVQAQVASIVNIENAMHTAAGGKEKFEEIRRWASTALPKEEREALVNLIAAGPAQAKIATETMIARFEAVHGRAPNLLSGNPGSGAVGYESSAQMKADMRDPRYKTDEAFRQKVAARLAVSTFVGRTM